MVNRAAHEVKDSLNGVSVNLEVIRSRAERAAAGIGSAVDPAAFAPFATSAADQLEAVTARLEALLFLARPAKAPADVALALRHLGAVLVPAAKANGGKLTLEARSAAAPTSASAQATRLALASGLLGLVKEGGSGTCRLETGAETVVRFSHESARACKLDPAVADALAGDSIQHRGSGSDLLLVFPHN